MLLQVQQVPHVLQVSDGRSRANEKEAILRRTGSHRQRNRAPYGPTGLKAQNDCVLNATSRENGKVTGRNTFNYCVQMH